MGPIPGSMKNILAGTILLLCQIGCTQSKSIPITALSAVNTTDMLLIDVRTPGEYAGGHLEGAMNINWLDADFKARAGELDKGKTIYVYCQKGGRSAKAAAVLDSMGYNVVDLLGGYSALPPDEH